MTQSTRTYLFCFLFFFFTYSLHLEKFTTELSNFFFLIVEELVGKVLLILPEVEKILSIKFIH